MDYEFEVAINEPIVIDEETVIKVTSVIGTSKIKLGIDGPHKVCREEIESNKQS